MTKSQERKAAILADREAKRVEKVRLEAKYDVNL